MLNQMEANCWQVLMGGGWVGRRVAHWFSSRFGLSAAGLKLTRITLFARIALFNSDFQWRVLRPSAVLNSIKNTVHR
jgi:hypothetical protein